MSEESINILYNNQESLSKTLEETIQIFNNGLTEEEDVEQLQITLASVNSNLARTKRQYTIAKQLLNLAMGIDINRNIVLSEKLENLASKFVQFGSITAGFNVEKHIDYKIAKNTERGKELLMKLEESRKLPTLNGFLNYGINGFSDSFDFFNTDKKWFSFSQVGLNLKIPIFSGFARSAAIEKSKIELSKYRTDLFELEQKLKLNVATAKTDYNFFISELSNALKNLALAERIEKKQQIKYFEGISSSFEFSEAQRQLYTMQQNYLKSLFEVISSKAKLDSALNEPIDNKK
jgi:outer membrane protein TolC